MRRMIGFLLGVLLLGVARSMRTGAWCLRGSAASGGHRAAALVGMGLGLARPVALMRDRRRAPTKSVSVHAKLRAKLRIDLVIG